MILPSTYIHFLPIQKGFFKNEMISCCHEFVYFAPRIQNFYGIKNIFSFYSSKPISLLYAKQFFVIFLHLSICWNTRWMWHLVTIPCMHLVTWTCSWSCDHTCDVFLWQKSDWTMFNFDIFSCLICCSYCSVFPSQQQTTLSPRSGPLDPCGAPQSSTSSSSLSLSPSTPWSSCLWTGQ